MLPIYSVLYYYKLCVASCDCTCNSSFPLQNGAAERRGSATFNDLGPSPTSFSFRSPVENIVVRHFQFPIWWVSVGEWLCPSFPFGSPGHNYWIASKESCYRAATYSTLNMPKYGSIYRSFHSLHSFIIPRKSQWELEPLTPSLFCPKLSLYRCMCCSIYSI